MCFENVNDIFVHGPLAEEVEACDCFIVGSSEMLKGELRWYIVENIARRDGNLSWR